MINFQQRRQSLVEVSIYLVAASFVLMHQIVMFISSWNVLLQKQFRGAISSLFKRRIRSDGSIIDLWSAGCNIKFSAQLTSLWCVALISTFWAIWHVRNLFMFENQVPSIHHALSIIWASICETNGLTSGAMANQVEELAILHTLHIPCRPLRAPRIIEVLWKPPPLGWIKVNTNGAAFGCLGLASSGGIFRNCKGFVHGCFAIHIGMAFAFEVELVASI